MDDEDNDYEAERQKTIAENQVLLNSLGLDPNGSSKINFPKPEPTKSRAGASAAKKRKSTASTTHDEGPRRRSGRIAGLEADGEELKVKLEAEEKEREVLRVVARKEREQVMVIMDMAEEADQKEKDELKKYFEASVQIEVGRQLPDESTSATDAYADLEPEQEADEVTRLKDQFKNMELRSNVKVTNDRVFSMVVHPDKARDLVFVGDKYGCLGIWDASSRPTEKASNENDTNGVNTEADAVESEEVWRIQAHARNSITAMKVEPTIGSGLYSSSYDCTLRHLDFQKLTSTEVFAHQNEDMLITHFDLTPNGHEAWLADKNGGISHCDFREGQKDRRRWVVQEEGRAAKLGGLSINPLMPHLLVTAGNDQHLRIWDTRHFSHLNPRSTEVMTPPPTAKDEDGKPPRIDTYPTSTIGSEKVNNYMSSAKGKGLHRASYQHGKSCSAAYWDPWGRRILTTSYDDKLRIWSLNPDIFDQDAPLPPTHFKPTKQIPHNCQTGRWLTILRAQWSLNMDYIPHFTVGNMKRSLDVVASTGDKIVSLWADPVTAVPAVTASHPGRVDHVFGGSTSGRIQFWASADRPDSQS